MTETRELPSVPSDNNKQYEGSNDADMEPSHHARRPMNAFLIFCKRHRSVVRDKYPNLENRSITKILGEWWANLDKEEKASYTGLAKQYKDAFFDANPDFKWYKLPAPPLRTFTTRPCNTSINSNNYLDQENVSNDTEGKVKPTNNNSIKLNYNPSTSKSRSMFTPGKLADETQMGGLSSLILPDEPEDPDEDYLKKNCDLSKSTNLNNQSKIENCTINYNTTGPPKKRPFIEVNDGDSKEDEVNCDIKLRKLQDELSETSRVFQLSYDSADKDDYEEANCKERRTANSLNDKFKQFFTQNGTNNSNLSSKHHNDYSYRKNDHEQSQCKEPSKRSCKGKRYQEFMAFGGLMVNKRSKRDDLKYSNSPVPTHSWKSYEEYMNDNTQKSSEPVDETENNIPKSAYNDMNDINDTRQHTFYYDENSLDQSKDSDTKANKVFKASDFDLDAKIKALPSLSLEKFQQKKKDNKKRRKNMSSSKHKDYKPHLSTHLNLATNSYQPTNYAETPKPSDMDSHTQFKANRDTSMEAKMRLAEEHKSAIIGSRKRKPRKFSITRLDVNSPMKMQQMNIESAKIVYTSEVPTITATSTYVIPDQNPHMAADICGLTALAEAAEVAAKIQN